CYYQSDSLMNIYLADNSGVLETNQIPIDWTARYRLRVSVKGQAMRFALWKDDDAVAVLKGTAGGTLTAAGKVGFEYLSNPSSNTEGLYVDSWELFSLDENDLLLPSDANDQSNVPRYVSPTPDGRILFQP